MINQTFRKSRKLFVALGILTIAMSPVTVLAGYDDAWFKVNHYPDSPDSVNKTRAFDKPILAGTSVELIAHGTAGANVRSIESTKRLTDPNGLISMPMPGTTTVHMPTNASKPAGQYPLGIGGKYVPEGGSGGGDLPDWSGQDTANVANIVIAQFNPKPSKFPKCQGSGISKADFNIVTDPLGHSDQVTVQAPQGTTTLGWHPATATLLGNTKATAYQVIRSGEWYPYKQLSQFDSAADSEAPDHQSDIDEAENVRGVYGSPVKMKLYMITTFKAKRKGSLKKPGGNATVNIGTVQADTTEHNGSVDFSLIDSVSVSYTGQWRHHSAYNTNVTVGGANDPRGHWLTVYQVISTTVTHHREWFDGNLVINDSHSQGSKPLNDWIYLSSAKCN